MQIKGHTKDYARIALQIINAKKGKFMSLKHHMDKNKSTHPDSIKRYHRICVLCVYYVNLYNQIEKYIKDKKADRWLARHEQLKCNVGGLPRMLLDGLVIKELPMSKLESHKSQSFNCFRANGVQCQEYGCDRKGTRIIQILLNDLSISTRLFTDDFIALSVDHIIPKSRGGSNTISNYQTMCLPHNKAKSNTIPFTHMMKAEQNNIVLTQTELNSAMDLKMDLAAKVDIVVAHRLIVLNTSCTHQKIEFNLSFKFLKKLMSQKTCYYSGETFVEGDENLSRTLDRVDPTKGCTEDNVVACTRYFSTRKSDMTLTILKKMVKSIEKFTKPKAKKASLKLVKPRRSA